MRILLISPKVPPDLGGVEVTAVLLARALVADGHDVVVVTRTPNPEPMPGLRGLLTDPGWTRLLAEHRKADLVLHNVLTTRLAWPLLIFRRRWVVVVRTWIRRNDGSIALIDRFKRFALRGAFVISNSEATAADLGVHSTVIHNGYRPEVFFAATPSYARPRDLVFVGRLTASKGVEDLLQALVLLKRRGIEPSLTVVGAGEQLPRLEEVTASANLGDQVRIVGPLRDTRLAEELNRHKVIVVPSRWREPFGNVALEGAACGCLPVVSEEGGLVEAAGPGAITFKNGDSESLACALVEALNVVEGAAGWTPPWEHLRSHTEERMAENYRAAIRTVVGG